MSVGTLSLFVGRRQELEQVRELVEARRLVTIIGPGGAGKTRLALEAVDGIVVELAPLADPRLVPGAILDAVGVHEQPPGDLLDVAATALADRDVVLVIDNCEHLRGAVAEAASRLLAACPQLRVLATSRAGLGVPGEVTWPIPPLHEDEAVDLFLARAADVQPDAEHAADVVRGICRDLDGMPLAIELAAARTRMLTPHEIAAGLSNRLQLLGAGVRRSLDWSHGLLAEHEQVLFRRLSVFAGGWTLETAALVCGDDILDPLAALVEQSLVIADRTGEHTRYRMLESMRLYAAEQLAAAGEAEAIGRRHLEVFLDLARADRDTAPEEANLRAAIAFGLRHDPSQALRLATAAHYWWVVAGRYQEALDAVEQALALGAAGVAVAERAIGEAAASYLAHHSGNFPAALEHGRAAMALAEEAEDDFALGCASTVLGNAIAILFSPSEGVVLVERGVALLKVAGPRSRALQIAYGSMAANNLLCDRLDKAREGAAGMASFTPAGFALFSKGWVHAVPAMAAFQQGDFGTALTQAEAALEGAGQSGSVARATAFAARALTRVYTGDARRALDETLEEIERVERHGARFGLPRLHHAAAVAELALGDVDAAAARSTTFRNAAHMVMAAYHCEVLGRVGIARGDAAAAAEAGDAMRGFAERSGGELQLGAAEHILGRAALLDGEWQQARDTLHAALERFERVGSAWRVCEALEALASVALAAQDEVGAARLLGAVSAERARLGAVPVPPPAESSVERSAAWDEGAALSLAEAIAWARRMRGARNRPLSGWDSLTPAERQVAELAAAGLKNAEIGERLFITAGTAKLHLSRVYAKLGVRSRVELAAAAARRG